MKKWLITGMIFVSILFCGVPGHSQERILQIYKNIVKMAEKNTPSSYTVEVENKKFEEALGELPEDILTGEGAPAVKIQFSKGEGVKIIIENIKSEYATLFSMYEEYFKFSGISKVQNPVEFKQIIDNNQADFYKENKEFVIVQAWDPEKKERDNNYALFSLDRKMWVIKKAVFYLDGIPFVQAENSYKSFGEYYLPYKIELKYLDENTADIFLFKDYHFGK